MADSDKTRIFRMTHIENVPHMLENGITHQLSVNKNPDFKPIGDNSLIRTRSEKVIFNGKKLGDYIPFYFGYRTPMLYVIQKGRNNVAVTNPEEIVYCVSTVQKILDSKLDFIFTNGHAVDGLTKFYQLIDVDKIADLVDFEAAKVLFWKSENDLDLKRRKEAEFLVASDLPPDVIVGWVVFSQKVKEKLAGMGIPSEKIVVKPDFYF